MSNILIYESLAIAIHPEPIATASILSHCAYHSSKAVIEEGLKPNYFSLA
jgi:hypothetical protein